MSTENQLTTTEFPRASTALSLQLGLEPRVMIDALKSQFFKGKDATDAQLAVVISIAKELKLNPLLPGQLYPYPDRTGSVVVMIGPDGIYTMLANNSDIVAQKDGGPAFYTEHGVENGKETCTAYINHKTKGLLKKTIWVDEWVVGSNPNWASRRHHMSEIRALKQCARLVIHGIPADADEHAIGEMMNVTPAGEAPGTPVVPRPDPKPRKTRGAAAVQEVEIVTPAAGADPAISKREQLAQKLADPAEAAKAVAVAEGTSPEQSVAPVAADKSPRVFLQDGESITADVEVISAEGVNISQNGKPVPSVKATVKGDYNNVVRMIAAGITGDNQTVTPAKPWEVGAKLRLKLKGKKSAATSGPNVGQVLAWVESAEVITPAAAEGEEG